MARREDVPGGWVDLRDPAKIPNRMTEAITEAQIAFFSSYAAQQIADTDTSEIAPAEKARLMGVDVWRLQRDLTKTTMLAHIEAWSFELPVTLDGLGDLPRDAFEAIEALVDKAESPNLNTEPSPDPASPSEPSST